MSTLILLKEYPSITEISKHLNDCNYFIILIFYLVSTDKFLVLFLFLTIYIFVGSMESSMKWLEMNCHRDFLYRQIFLQFFQMTLKFQERHVLENTSRVLTMF